MRTEIFDKYKSLLNLKEMIGYGVDGDAYSLNSSDKILKISFLYDYGFDIERVYNNLKSNIQSVIELKPKCFVNTHSFKQLESGYRKFLINDTFTDQKYYIFCYEMDCCTKLTEDEKRVFHSILLNKNSFKENYISLLNGMNDFLDFNIENVINFVNEVQQSSIKHIDISTCNIMKFNDEFKLIDLDRII